MSEAILRFILPEEKDDFVMASRAADYYLALYDIEQAIRSIWKYEDLTDDENDLIEKVRAKFYDILDDHGVNLDEVH